MADGIRQEVRKLAWVSGVKVHILDHMFADEINDGIENGHDFAEIFSRYSNGEDLAALRQKFEMKAFQRRQESLLLDLKSQGFGDHQLAEFGLGTLRDFTFQSDEAQAQKPRYLELRCREGMSSKPGDPAFCTYDGEPLTAAGMERYLGQLRAVRINMEFNGTLCRRLQQTRYKECVKTGGEPTLVDFILERVPPRELEEAIRTG